jgi:hypothetical protein
LKPLGRFSLPKQVSYQQYFFLFYKAFLLVCEEGGAMRRQELAAIGRILLVRSSRMLILGPPGQNRQELENISKAERRNARRYLWIRKYDGLLSTDRQFYCIGL